MLNLSMYGNQIIKMNNRDLGLCEYKGCRKNATHMDSWFNICCCDEHNKVAPAFFVKEDDYYKGKYVKT